MATWIPESKDQSTREKVTRVNSAYHIRRKVFQKPPTTEKVIVDKPRDLEGALQAFHKPEVLEL